MKLRRKYYINTLDNETITNFSLYFEDEKSKFQGWYDSRCYFTDLSHPDDLGYMMNNVEIGYQLKYDLKHYYI